MPALALVAVVLGAVLLLGDAPGSATRQPFIVGPSGFAGAVSAQASTSPRGSACAWSEASAASAWSSAAR